MIKSSFSQTSTNKVGLFGEVYANVALSPASSPMNYGWQGLSYDGAIGKWNNLARTYDQNTGAFSSQEPTGADGPNLFWALRNNPIRYKDPDGLSAKRLGNILKAFTQSVGVQEGLANALTETSPEAAVCGVAGGVIGTITGGPVVGFCTGLTAASVCDALASEPIVTGEEEKRQLQQYQFEKQNPELAKKLSEMKMPALPEIDPYAGTPQIKRKK